MIVKEVGRTGLLRPKAVSFRQKDSDASERLTAARRIVPAVVLGGHCHLADRMSLAGLPMGRLAAHLVMHFAPLGWVLRSTLS